MCTDGTPPASGATSRGLGPLQCSACTGARITTAVLHTPVLDHRHQIEPCRAHARCQRGGEHAGRHAEQVRHSLAYTQGWKNVLGKDTEHAMALDTRPCTFRLAPVAAVQQGIACLASTLTDLFLGIPLDALLYGGACHLQPVTLQGQQHPAQNEDLAAAVAGGNMGDLMQVRRQNACSGLLQGVFVATQTSASPAQLRADNPSGLEAGLA